MRRRVRGWTSGVALMCSALAGLGAMAPALAPAEPWSVSAGRHVPVGGPALAGAEVVFTVPRAAQGFDVKAAIVGGDARSLLAAPYAPHGDYKRQTGQVLTEVAASPSRLLVRSRFFSSGRTPTGDVNVEDLGVWTAATGGPFERLAGRCFGPAFVFSQAIDLDGAVAAFRPSGCEVGFTVRDFSGAAPMVTLPRVESFPRLAGRFLAWIEGDELVHKAHDLGPVARRRPNLILGARTGRPGDKMVDCISG